MLIGYLLLVASLYAWAAMHFGSFAAVGVASLGGGLLGASNPEAKEKIAKGFESVLASIPVGILLVVIGMEVNVKAIEGFILFLIVLLIVVIGTKLIGCRIAANKGVFIIARAGLHHVWSFGSRRNGDRDCCVPIFTRCVDSSVL